MTRRTTLVAAIVLCALAATAALSAVAIQTAYDSGANTERSKLVATAEVAAELLSQQMRGVEDLATATLARPDFSAAVASGPGGSIDGAALQPILGQLQAVRPDLQFAAVADAQGTTRANAPADPSVIGRNFAYRDWYRGVVRSGSAYVSTAYVSAVTGAPLVVAIATPIRGPAGASAAIRGILFVGLKLAGVQSFADRLAAVQHIDLQVTDQAGTVIARRGGIAGRLDSAAQVPLVAAALAGRTTTSTTDVALTAAVPVPGLGWTVSAGTPLAATAAAQQRSSSWLIAGILLFVLVIAGGFLVVATGRIESTRQRQAASEAELRTVHHALTDPVQFFGPDGSLISRNPAAEKLYQLGPEDRTTDDFLPRWELLREDGSPLPLDEGPLAVTMRSGATTHSLIAGIRNRADAAVTWLSVSTAPIRGAGGELQGYVSAARDITERISTIRELRVLGQAAELLGSSLVPDRVVHALTSSAAELCSAPGEPSRRAQLFVIDGRTMVMTGEDDAEGAVRSEGARLLIADHPYIQTVIATRQPVSAAIDYDRFGPTVAPLMRLHQLTTCVWIPLLRDDRVFAVLAIAGRQHAAVTPDQLERLRTLANVGQLALINAEAHQRVEELARTDVLTGVGNRRALEDRLAHLPRSPFGLVAIDVDNLKTVNDTYGHEAGDELLRAVAAACAAELRPSDLLARVGGDEFIALLTDCDAAGAVALGRRLTAAVARVRLGWGTPGISVGTAASAPGGSPEAVAKAADVDLYAAKRAKQAAAAGAGMGR